MGKDSVVMVTSNNEKYQCLLPKIDDENDVSFHRITGLNMIIPTDYSTLYLPVALFILV